jgi:hypothetical protein
MLDQPFNPQYGKTQAAPTAAGAVNLTFDNIGTKQLLLTNVGTVLAFVRVKPNGVATDASAADLPLPAGSQRIITRDAGNQSNDNQQMIVSVFASGAGSTVYVTPGEGYGP